MKFNDYLITALSYIKQAKKRRLIEAAYKLRNKAGIEIGGPSALFRLKAAFPVYIFAKKIDGVNFSTDTVWEGNIQAGETYNYYKDKIGSQFITEATDLQAISSNSYDFLLSCHSLEHVANPLKAIMEWKRVLKNGGTIVLVLPDKRNTFDINRPYTQWQHLLEDFRNNTDERDQTHFEEIIKFHDHNLDPSLKSKEEVINSLNKNFENRMAHHHVFSQEVVRQMFQYSGFSVKGQYEIEPFHLITVAEKQ